MPPRLIPGGWQPPGVATATPAIVGMTPLGQIPMIGLIMQVFSLGALAAVMPVLTVAYWLAYEDRKAEIHTEAAAGGVNLPA